MDVYEYYESLMNSMRGVAAVDGSSVEYEFLEHGLSLMSESGEFEEPEIVIDGRDSSGYWRIDGYSFNLDFGELDLFLVVFDHAEKPANLVLSDIETVSRKGMRFLNNVLRKSVYEFFGDGTASQRLAVEIRDEWPKIDSLNVYIISNRPLSNRIKATSGGEIDGKPVTFQIWDLGRFYALESSVREREEMIVDLSDSPLPCLVANHSGSHIKSILAVMDATHLVNLYQTWKSRLLEQNVRSFLQFKARGVNAGIRDTIADKPEYFFAYNNGLTTTAEDVTIEDIDGKQVITSITNFQIVNGGQTTASLYHAWKSGFDVSQISVQMKLTVVEPSKVAAIVPDIAKFANRQNAINAADLFSSHPFHTRMEQISRKLLPPPPSGSVIQQKWFYERSRGQYLNEQSELSVAKKKQFKLENPRSQLITKTDLALSENTWVSKPAIVSKGAQFNIKPFAKELIEPLWDQDDSVFDTEYFKKVVCRILIARTLRKEVLAAHWYGGYPANIVAYTVAWFAHNLKKHGRDIDYDIVWQAQKPPETLMLALLDMASHVNDHIQSTNRNVSTYCKLEECWKSALSYLPGFDLDAIACLKATPVTSKAKEGRQVKLDSDTSGQSSISGDLNLYSIAPSDWYQILTYLDRSNLLFPIRHKNILKLQGGRKISVAAENSLRPLVKKFLDSGGKLTGIT